LQAFGGLRIGITETSSAGSQPGHYCFGGYGDYGFAMYDENGVRLIPTSVHCSNFCDRHYGNDKLLKVFTSKDGHWCTWSNHGEQTTIDVHFAKPVILKSYRFDCHPGFNCMKSWKIAMYRYPIVGTWTFVPVSYYVDVVLAKKGDDRLFETGRLAKSDGTFFVHRGSGCPSGSMRVNTAAECQHARWHLPDGVVSPEWGTREWAKMPNGCIRAKNFIVQNDIGTMDYSLPQPLVCKRVNGWKIAEISKKEQVLTSGVTTEVAKTIEKCHIESEEDCGIGKWDELAGAAGEQTMLHSPGSVTIWRKPGFVASGFRRHALNGNYRRMTSAELKEVQWTGNEAAIPWVNDKMMIYKDGEQWKIVNLARNRRSLALALKIISHAQVGNAH